MKNKLIQRNVAQARIHNHMLIRAKKAGLEASVQVREFCRDTCMQAARALKEEDNAAN